MMNEIDSFHTKLKTWILPLLYLSTIFGLIFFISIFLKDRGLDESLKAVMPFMAVLILLFTVLFTIVNFTYLVTVYTEGISAYDPYGSWKRNFMEWSSMKRISHKNLLGVKYYCIESEPSRQKLWIPINLVRKEEFIQAVIKQTGNNHILVKKLMNLST